MEKNSTGNGGMSGNGDGLANPGKRRSLAIFAGVAGGMLSGCVIPGGAVRQGEMGGGLSSREVFDMWDSGRDPMTGAQAVSLDTLRAAKAAVDEGIARQERALLKPLAGQTVDEAALNIGVPFATLIREAVRTDGMDTTQAKPVRGRVFDQNGRTVIPRGAMLAYTQKGFCMDPNLPAPGKGDALSLQPMGKRIPDDMAELYRALGRWAARPENNGMGQSMTWSLMSAGTERGKWIENMSQSDVNRWNGVMPGAADMLRRKQGSWGGGNGGDGGLSGALNNIAKQLERERAFLDELMSGMSSPAGAERLMEKLIVDGQSMQGGKGIGYSEIAPGVHARAQGADTLTGTVEIINLSDGDFEFDLGRYYLEPQVRKQGISATPDIRAAGIRTFQGNGGGQGAGGRPWASLAEGLRQEASNLLNEANSNLAKSAGKALFKKSLEWLQDKTPGSAAATRKALARAGASSGVARAAAHVVGATPVLGNLLSLSEVVTGRDWMTGKELSNTEYALAVAGTIPGANLLKSLGKGIRAAGGSREVAGVLARASERTFFQVADKVAPVPGALALAASDTGRAVMGKVGDFSVETVGRVKTALTSADMDSFWSPPTAAIAKAIRSGQAFFN